MPDFDKIYNDMAWKYDLLVSREDHENHLLANMESICQLKDKVAVDLGTGTGRVSFLLAPFVKKVYAFDITAGMIAQAEEKRKKRDIKNIVFAMGDNRKIPLPDNTADLAVEGWSFGMMKAWNLPDWEKAIDRSLAEISRVVKNCGSVILIETLGTMKTRPEAPEFLRPLYDYIEKKHGFVRETISTDYRFESVNEAVDLTTFFFDEAAGNEVRKRNSAVVPEFTGVWHQKVKK